MRIVLAPDSFKESMTAREAARAMAQGVKDADPRARTVLAPMSDGGEGFVDADGRPLAPRPDPLDRLAAIDASALAPLLDGATIRVACDVTNPLTGPNGATAVFGPQKGATADLVPRLERAPERVARVSGHRDQADAPGSGAARLTRW